MDLLRYTYAMEDSAQVENEKKQKIHEHLREAGHEVETVEPMSPETPFPETPEILEAGGEIVKGVFQDLADGSNIRTTDNQRLVPVFRQRLAKMAKSVGGFVLKKAA